MSDFSTEEEQVAALKKWWKENGNSLLMGIGAALLIVFGWKTYENSVLQAKTAASLQYQQLLTVATQSTESEEDEANTVSYLAQQLIDEYPDTEYALYAALFIAKDKALNKDYDGALEQLNWVIANTDDLSTKHIVNGRIARILSAKGMHDEALEKLVATEKAFEASYLEIAGDIKLRKGDRSGAAENYKQAFALVKDVPQSQPLLAVKLSDLGVDPETL